MRYNLKLKNSFRAKHYGWTVPDKNLFLVVVLLRFFLFSILCSLLNENCFQTQFLWPLHTYTFHPRSPHNLTLPHTRTKRLKFFSNKQLEANSNETIFLSLLTKRKKGKKKKNHTQNALVSCTLHFVDSPTMQVGCWRLRKHACDVLSMAGCLCGCATHRNS